MDLKWQHEGNEWRWVTGQLSWNGIRDKNKSKLDSEIPTVACGPFEIVTTVTGPHYNTVLHCVPSAFIVVPSVIMLGYSSFHYSALYLNDGLLSSATMHIFFSLYSYTKNLFPNIKVRRWFISFIQTCSPSSQVIVFCFHPQPRKWKVKMFRPALPAENRKKSYYNLIEMTNT